MGLFDTIVDWIDQNDASRPGYVVPGDMHPTDRPGNPASTEQDLSFGGNNVFVPGSSAWQTEQQRIYNSGWIPGEGFREPSPTGRGASGSAHPSFEYLNAALAEAYGMNKATAYQEALANTAHQREVQDLLAAGLNPVLSAAKGSGADVFAGSDSTGTGSSGGGHHGSSAKNADKKNLSWLPTVLGAGASIALSLTGNPAIAAAGGAAARGLTQALVNAWD